LPHSFDVGDGGEVFAGDALDDQPAASPFAAQAGHSH
jgi:hypothetical protein